MDRPKTRISRLELTDPTDYATIFRLVDGELFASPRRGRDWPKRVVFTAFQVSPAMVAVWVLLGKSRYPATLAIRN